MAVYTEVGFAEAAALCQRLGLGTLIVSFASSLGATLAMLAAGALAWRQFAR